MSTRINRALRSPSRTIYCLAALIGMLAPASGVDVIPAPAPVPSPTQVVVPVPIPSFWDPKRRPELPDLSRLSQIRFLTEIDYPPFNFAGPDGSHAGFNVDLARMICE